MGQHYHFYENIELLVKGRISSEDADRQKKTAREILSRFDEQPGVILADEVGMGKTFVALAVAVSVAKSDPNQRPVVVMVPPSLKQKWPADFELFRERCLDDQTASRLQAGQADNAVEFLKLLDDPPENRKSLLFVTHGTMSRGLTDKWTQAALIRQSLLYKRDAENIKAALARIMPGLLGMKKLDRYGTDLWIDLFKTPPQNWLRILSRYGIDPEFDNDPATDDDPVPESINGILPTLDTSSVYEALKQIPQRRSANFDLRLKDARSAIRTELRSLWETCVQKLQLSLPLLILDEAHHLKNSKTRLASLFYLPESQEDAEEIASGPLAGTFERMLFLTATPFQLGHGELCSVLERFSGIDWQSDVAPNGGRQKFKEETQNLRTLLDSAQEAAVVLDNAWGGLRHGDLVVDDQKFGEVDRWWEEACKGGRMTSRGEEIMGHYARVKRRMEEAEESLRPYVIRHLRSRQLPPPYSDVVRRKKLAGKSILTDIDDTEEGIEISGKDVLPFLLAARATAQAPESRPVFAEGLASSYEAFLHTRKSKRESIDDDDDAFPVNEPVSIEGVEWYLNQLETLIPRGDASASAGHPKIAATVDQVVNIWEKGEKVLIFCHYIATGKALRQRISEAVDAKIKDRAARVLGCKRRDVPGELDRIGRRFFDQDSPVRRACDGQVLSRLEKFPKLETYHQTLVEIVRRNVRTPSFLARFFPLRRENLNESAMLDALRRKDRSGQTLSDLLDHFFRFLVDRCGEKDRQRYIEAVNRIQTGAYYGRSDTFDQDELQGAEADALVPNVRLVNGATNRETRQRIMLTFNTPFFPEILITSAVMAEGVDLHLNCRFIIHHDLCWNPSTLEQRTGRLDRINAKVENVGRPINVYLPYIAETQDEKMYRVVMDRERWFNVVMGENYKVDAKTTERLSERIPFPESAARQLAFRLGAAG